MAWDSDGFTLQLQGCNELGKNVCVLLKLWARHDGTIRWGLRGCLTGAGYKFTKSNKPSKIVDQRLEQWEEWWTSLKLPLDKTFGRSGLANSRRASKDQKHAADTDEPEAWVDTRGLLGLLTWWGVNRRGGHSNTNINQPVVHTIQQESNTPEQARSAGYPEPFFNEKLIHQHRSK